MCCCLFQIIKTALLFQIKTAGRGQIRPRPPSECEWECWWTPEPPVRGERHSAEDWGLYPWRPNHCWAQQTDTGRHEGQRDSLTTAGTNQSETELHLRLQVNQLAAQELSWELKWLTRLFQFCFKNRLTFSLSRYTSVHFDEVTITEILIPVRFYTRM